jgi:hypothetical protein
MPNMVDSSGWSVADRYRVALINYADKLVADQKYCEAREFYEQALAMAPNPEVAATATEVQLICEPPQPTAQPTAEITPIFTETPTTEVGITETPTVEPTPPSETVVPTP